MTVAADAEKLNVHRTIRRNRPVVGRRGGKWIRRGSVGAEYPCRVQVQVIHQLGADHLGIRLRMAFRQADVFVQQERLHAGKTQPFLAVTAREFAVHRER